MRFVLVSAGPVGPLALAQIMPSDYVIACDGGWRHLEKLGRKPDLVVGDFDSSQPPQLEQVVVLPTEKDDTDTHYAARLALERGARQVLMLGALGGARMEHTLANIGTALWLQKQGCQAELHSEESRLCILCSGQQKQLPHNPEQYFSLFPLEGTATGINITGAKYPLQEGVLEPQFPLAISNETCPQGACITAGQGALLMVITQKDKQN